LFDFFFISFMFFFFVLNLKTFMSRHFEPCKNFSYFIKLHSFGLLRNPKEGYVYDVFWAITLWPKMSIPCR
jgi:hypothetical protein